jgi:diguanylate cyclase (GGDEF)-like protein/PAS domain S-box-containing protein
MHPRDDQLAGNGSVRVDVRAAAHVSLPETGSRRTKRRVPTNGLLPIEIALFIAIAGIAVLMTTAILEMQTSARAYIVGESQWSKAQQEAAHQLHRYARSGSREDLLAARTALAIPLGDMQARIALEKDPPDRAAARAGFLQGNNAEADVDRMVRMFLYLRDAPYFRESVLRWREGDEGILELVRLADELEAAHTSGPVDESRVLDFQSRARSIDRHLRPIETSFSRNLSDGARMLTSVLILLGILTFVVLAWAVIHLLRASLRRIRDSEGAFSAAFHQAAVGMLKMKPDGSIVEANETLCRILGKSVSQLCQLRLQDLLQAGDRQADRVGGEPGPGGYACGEPTEHRYIHADGGTRWLRWTLSTIDGGDRGEERIFAIVEDVSAGRRLSDEMAYQASHDALTGLINRREIEKRLQLSLQSAAAQGEQHAFLFLDLDQFKLVNDTCGHVAGDQLLCQIAGVLLLHMRSSDWTGRLGGDEFAVFLRHTDADEAVRIGERLRRALSNSEFHWEGRSFNVTCSVGIVPVGADSDDVNHVLRAADRACYQAKEDGRDCIRVYLESDQAMARRREEMAWVGDLRQAVADDRIVLFAQCIEALRGPPGLRYEVLVRLVDPHGRIYSPDAFLPAAERYGEIVGLDRLVISMALRRLAEHPDHLQCLELCHLNVSAQSMVHPEFRAHVASELDASGVPPRKLCFELTETAAIANLVHAQEVMDDMRSRGCRIALDDFGSGLSSFAYLKNLTIDILKIDGVFIRDLANNEVDPILVRSMCEAARSLGKITVAEWVEDERLLPRLRELGVDQAQGYAIHEPCALDELLARPQPCP